MGLNQTSIMLGDRILNTRTGQIATVVKETYRADHGQLALHISGTVLGVTP